MTASDHLGPAPDPSGLPPFGILLSMMPMEMPVDPAVTTEGLRRTHPELADVEIEDITITPTVPARIYRTSRSSGQPIFVWTHGGAFIGGDLDFPEANWVGLALASHGITVVSVDYRKALDGVGYPAPVDDVVDAFAWVAANAHRWGGGTVHLGGASAGASLALSAALRIRDQADRTPSTVTLVYPSLHQELPFWDTAEIAEIQTKAGATYFSSAWVREMNANYLRDGGDDGGTYAFPGENDLTALPPQLVIVAENDSLRSSGELYATAATSAGGDVTLVSEPHAVHGFLNAPGDAGNAEAIARIAGFIHDHS